MNFEFKTSSIPVYRTRKFWGVVLSIFFVVNLILFNWFGFRIESILGFLTLSVHALGGGAVYLVFATIINNHPHAYTWSALLYIPILLLLIRKIQTGKSVLRASLILFLLMTVSLCMFALLSASTA